MDETIKFFVRDILGCGCTDEVFSLIDSKRDVKVYGDSVVDMRINIGNRLLIYIKKIRDPEFFKESLAFMLKAGKDDMDSGGFNRFRLAVVSPGISEYAASYQAICDEVSDSDEKIHLHFLEPENDIINDILS